METSIVKSSPLPSGAIIVLATVGFAIVAWRSPLPRETNCALHPQIIRYFPEPEPKPITPAVHWRWPVWERGTPIVTPTPVDEPSGAEPKGSAVEEAPRERMRHLRRHWRHWRRW